MSISTARTYLKVYFDKAKSKLPAKDFEGFIQHYRVDHFLLENYGDYREFDESLERLGKTFENHASRSDILAAMDTLARTTVQGKVPNIQSFYDVLAGQVDSFTFQDFKGVVKKTASDVGGVVVTGLSLWAAKVLAGAALLYFVKKQLR